MDIRPQTLFAFETSLPEKELIVVKGSRFMPQNENTVT